MKKRGIKYYYDHFEEILIVITLVVMTILVFLQVVLRYIFNSGIVWSEEVSRYLFVWVSWLGLGLGARENQHIKVEMLVNKLKGNQLLAVKILSDLIVLAINVFVVYEGVRLMNMTLLTHKKSALLHCTMAIFQAAVPVGCGLMCIRNIEDIVKTWNDHKNGTLGMTAGEAAKACAAGEEEGGKV